MLRNQGLAWLKLIHFYPTPNRPVGRGARNESAQIAGFVCELKNFRSKGLLVRRLQLQSLSAFFWQPLVVGHLGDKVSDVRPEYLSD
jgi:hypothetical protein